MIANPNFVDQDDVERMVNDLAASVDDRVCRADYLNAMRSQTEINETLCAETCTARWFWKSGNLSANGCTIPWEQQQINTCPENFIWKEDQSMILTNG